jgi:hypothetical protein
MMAGDTLYALIQWEDRFLSVIKLDKIVKPIKNVTEYAEGEIVSAKYGQKVFEAVICEVHCKFPRDRRVVCK